MLLGHLQSLVLDVTAVLGSVGTLVVKLRWCWVTHGTLSLRPLLSLWLKLPLQQKTNPPLLLRSSPTPLLTPTPTPSLKLPLVAVKHLQRQAALHTM